MVKVTQVELQNKLQKAIQFKEKVTVKFQTKLTAMDCVACFEIVKDKVPFKDITVELHKLLEESSRRTYSGEITSEVAGRYNMLLNNGTYKSFFITNVIELSVGGFTYTR